MSLLRPFSALDLFAFNAINLDVWTEMYGVSYYLSYLMHWGDLFSCVLLPFSPLSTGRAHPHIVASTASSSRLEAVARST